MTFCGAEEWGVLAELGFQQRLGIQVGVGGGGVEGGGKGSTTATRRKRRA